LVVYLKTQKNEENPTHVLYQINFTCYHIESLHLGWVVTKKSAFQYIILNLILLLYQLTSFNWQRCIIKHKKKNILEVHALCPTHFIRRNSMWEPI